MYNLRKKVPKEGSFVQVTVRVSDLPDIYMGIVHYADRKTMTLEGLYEDTTPLKACYESGRFFPVPFKSLFFPKKNVSLECYEWKVVETKPSTEGQYLVYIDNLPVPLSIVRLHKSENYLCVIGGTHSFYAKGIEDVAKQLKANDLLVFPEFTNSIYDDVVSFLTLKMKRKLFQGYTQAAELKLCV